MKIEQKQGYILAISEEKSFTEFISNFKKEYKNLKENNIFIEFSNDFNINKEDISLFLPYADKHQENGKTFVIIYSNIDVDELPETFNVVPTLQEAEDVLEMENIQRDLGF